MSTLMPLRDVLDALENAGHTELWTTSPRGKDSFKDLPVDQSLWYLPNIITRDGRTVAYREKRPDGWILCGNWNKTLCRPGSVEPFDGEYIGEDWRFNLRVNGN